MQMGRTANKQQCYGPHLPTCTTNDTANSALGLHTVKSAANATITMHVHVLLDQQSCPQIVLQHAGAGC